MKNNKFFYFLNSNKFKVFLCLILMSLFSISIFNILLFANLYSKFKKILSFTVFLNLFFESSLKSSISILPLIVFIIFINKIINKPLNSFLNTAKTMLDNNYISTLSEEGPSEFKELSCIWNYLLGNTISFKEKNELLEHQSDIDGLTKLYNHRYFYDKLDNIFNTNDNPYITLIFFDIDKFKSVNDTYGHLIGDKILFNVASIIKNTIIQEGFAKNSIVARYGGEEITVMLLNTDKMTAFDISEKIRINISNSYKIKAIIQDRPITISSGIASMPYDSDNINDLIEKADKAMYFSKNNGRNQSTIYNDSLKNIKSSKK